MGKNIRSLWIVALALMLCIGSVGAKNYAVLVSAGEATADDELENSEFWYDLFLMYTTLIDYGYNHDDIWVLYGDGNDFQSAHSCYQNPYPITDLPVTKLNVLWVFSELADVMTNDDFLFVWWMGHGYEGPLHIFRFYILQSNPPDTTVLFDREFELYVNQIQHYRKRVFSFMTCYSGGIIDELEGPNTVVLTSADHDEPCESSWLCDTWHAEFNYYTTSAYAWETPCGICGAVDADYDRDGWISFAEAFQRADSYWGVELSDPQISDLGGWAPHSFVGPALYCCPQGVRDYSTIHDAIDVAESGYSVLLCHDTFSGPGNRNIDYGGKAITVRSRWWDPYNCVIDCQGAGNGFSFTSGEDSSSALKGITITNGSDGGDILPTLLSDYYELHGLRQ